MALWCPWKPRSMKGDLLKPWTSQLTLDPANPEALGLGEIFNSLWHRDLRDHAPLRDPVTLYPLTPTGSVVRMVDHSRGVVSWVRPTMQLNRNRFRGTTWQQNKLRSCFCVGYVLKLGQFWKWQLRWSGRTGLQVQIKIKQSVLLKIVIKPTFSKAWWGG